MRARVPMLPQLPRQAHLPQMLVVMLDDVQDAPAHRVRLRLRAKAIQERRYLHEVFAEIVEKGLAAEEAEQQKRRRKP